MSALKDLWHPTKYCETLQIENSMEDIIWYKVLYILISCSFPLMGEQIWKPDCTFMGNVEGVNNFIPLVSKVLYRSVALAIGLQ